MKLFNAECPKCAAKNRNLYLEETSGIFECENCHSVVKAKNIKEIKRIVRVANKMRIAT